MPDTSRRFRYAIAIGSNRAGRAGPPRRMVAAAIAALPGLVRASPIVDSAPLGPSLRRYANAAALVESALAPPALLALLKGMERAAGRRPGRRWGSRPLDLDIILWSDGAFAAPDLTIPHVRYRERRFVLDPLARIAPGWRDPLTGRTVRQSLARHPRALLTARRPAPTSRPRMMGL